MDVSTETTTATGKVCELYGDEQNPLVWWMQCTFSFSKSTKLSI